MQGTREVEEVDGLKKWLTLLILAGLLVAWTLPVPAAAAPVKTVIYYWGNGCPACKEAAPVIEKIIAGGISVEKYEVYENRENAERLTMSFKMHGVPEAEWAIPVAFYSGQMYTGVPRIMELEKELADARN